jgi:hypothetical protein
MTLIIIILVCGIVLAGLVRLGRGISRPDRSVDRYESAMERLSRLSRPTSVPPEAHDPAPLPEETEATVVARRLAGGRVTTVVRSSSAAPPLLRGTARVLGVYDRAKHRDPAVEANARLTATTGLVLLVLLFAEGVTIPFVAPLVSWHIAIGLALIPPVLLKMGSTLWRFSRYYLGDEAYRRAGPPHLLLRALGPLVMVSTVVLLASGVALWLAGPGDTTLFRIHQLSFVAWFVFVAIHVTAHFLRATRLAAADAKDASSSTPKLRGARGRRSAVGLALALGIVVGLTSHAISSPWTSREAPHPPAVAKPLRTAKTETKASTR